MHGANEGVTAHLAKPQLLVEIFLGAHQLARITESQLTQQGADLFLARGLLQIEHHSRSDPVLFQQGQGFTALGAARIVVDLGLAHDNSLINRKMGQETALL